MRYVSKDYVWETETETLEKDINVFIGQLESSGKAIAVNTDIFPSTDEKPLKAWEVRYVAF